MWKGNDRNMIQKRYELVITEKLTGWAKIKSYTPFSGIHQIAGTEYLFDDVYMFRGETLEELEKTVESTFAKIAKPIMDKHPNAKLEVITWYW